MAQLLHLVFGGDLVDPRGTRFRDTGVIDMVGIYPNYRTARDAWKAKAQAAVEGAHVCDFIAYFHCLADGKREARSREKLA